MGEESDLREANKKKVAVVNSGEDKGMDYCSHGGCGNRFTDSSKQGRQSWGLQRQQILGWGSWMGRKVLLSCTGSMFESGDF